MGKKSEDFFNDERDLFPKVPFKVEPKADELKRHLFGNNQKRTDN